MRFFNTAGPVNCDEHYCLPPLERLDLDEILLLIEQKKYFVLHAPRQVGKTSFLLALMEYLNSAGNYHCLYFNVEGAQAMSKDVDRATHMILGELVSRARTHLGDTVPLTLWQEIVPIYGRGGAFSPLLTQWAESCEKPLVLLIDEIDSLGGDTLITILRQLRAGYDKRPHLFPQSIVLCGVRDVRDYRLYSSQEQEIIKGGSAFNVKVKSLRMQDFTRQEMETLLRQHTEETEQQFEPGVFELVWELTRGQPWLVNALAYEVCFETKANRNRAVPITLAMIKEAKENIILRRETHLDQLVYKLKEERVRRVISPMLQGQDLSQAVSQDDIQYVIDLGLVRRGSKGLQMANAIYREVVPRELGFITQLSLESRFESTWYIQPDGSLDVDKLLTAFQQFFRQHSEHWVERFDYKEAGPQLLMQAFLQRIINAGGRIEREYGLGKMRTDLLVIWPYPNGVQQVVIELKVLHHSLEKTVAEGLEQTWQYMDKCGADVGHLVIFDRTPDKSWQEKIFRRQEMHRGQKITVWGM